jgi:hypothetical protein
MKTTKRSRQPQQPSLPLDLLGVADLMACLAQAVKQMQFYGVGSSGAQRAIDAARLVFDDVWAETDRLHCTVRSNSFEVEGQVVYEGDGLSDSLPFLFYKDGIRELIFLPGFESAELEAFLATLGRARTVRLDDDDLVTLLWQQDLRYLRYGYVDATADAAGGSAAEAGAVAGGGTATEDVAREGAAPGSGGGSSGAEEAAPPAPDVVVRPLPPSAAAAEAAPRQPWEDPAALPQARLSTRGTSATLLVLEPGEMAEIQRAIRLEFERDVQHDIVTALLDSLEDAPAAKQAEILFALAGLLPALLAAGRLDLVAATLSEVRGWAAPAEHAEAVAAVSGGPQMQAAVAALLAALQSGERLPHAVEIERLFAALGPVCFPNLVRASESVKNKEIRATLHGIVDRAANAHPEVAYAALGASDAVVLRSVLQRMQRYPNAGDARRVAKLLRHDDATVREAAVRVVVIGGGRDGVGALRHALADTSAEVRIAALWGLGVWRAQESRPDLEARLQDKALADAPAVEKMALFEAYARVAGPDAAPLLGRILTGRSGLGRRWPSDLRVCAARVLRITGSPIAGKLLDKAGRDDDDGVRRAAQRARNRLEDAA